MPLSVVVLESWSWSCKMILATSLLVIARHQMAQDHFLVYLLLCLARCSFAIKISSLCQSLCRHSVSLSYIVVVSQLWSLGWVLVSSFLVLMLVSVLQKWSCLQRSSAVPTKTIPRETARNINGRRRRGGRTTVGCWSWQHRSRSCIKWSRSHYWPPTCPRCTGSRRWSVSTWPC